MKIDIKKLSVNRKASKREVDMKRLMRKFEQIYAAVAFAEAGEADTAREIMREEKRDQKRERVIQRPRKQLRAPGIKR